MIDIKKFISSLKESGALREGDEVLMRTLDRIEPEYAAGWPERLAPQVRDAADSIGIERIYQHQFDAISESLGGSDVVMESPTASGKTLTFVLPILDHITRTRGGNALIIYPMKALAFDQREQIRYLCEKVGVDSWPYDGDTLEEHKSLLRQNKRPQILLSNPEYLNMSFLGHREKWQKFLRDLKYVVVDEMHEYRGFFGSNMALLLRRFFLHLKRIGASPRVFLSTATCANPLEHAKILTGRDVKLVSASDALRPERRFVFVNPDIPDYQYRDILRLRIEQAAITALEMGLQVLVFCPTKKFLEESFRSCQRNANERGLDRNKVSAFHADLKNETRQKIQQKIKSRQINVVFTTNALELGLDIGGLDGVMLAGFPPSIMSAWQQIGRAGRSWDKDAFVLFYAMNDPIDRFFVGNLDAFLKKPFDELVVDPANEELIDNHLSSLVAEVDGKIDPSEETILGSALYEAAKTAGSPVKGYRPQIYLNIRGGIGQSFKLKVENHEIGQISAMRRFREAYIGAIFPFFGQRYRVSSHEENAVVLSALSEIDQNLRTEPVFFTRLSETHEKGGVKPTGFRYDDIETTYGSLNIVMNFTGYKLVDEKRADQPEVKGGTANALFMNNHHAFWIKVPETADTSKGIGALEHMIRVGAMFVIPADRFDTSTYSMVGDGYAIAYYYENYMGGIGVAKKLLSVWQKALEKGVEIAKNCKCSTGCQNCIDPAKSYDISSDIDKAAGLSLAEEVLATAQQGPTHDMQNLMWKEIKK